MPEALVVRRTRSPCSERKATMVCPVNQSGIRRAELGALGSSTRNPRSSITTCPAVVVVVLHGAAADRLAAPEVLLINRSPVEGRHLTYIPVALAGTGLTLRLLTHQLMAAAVVEAMAAEVAAMPQAAGSRDTTLTAMSITTKPLTAVREVPGLSAAPEVPGFALSTIERR